MVARAVVLLSVLSVALASPISGGSSSAISAVKAIDNSWEDDALAELGVTKLRRQQLMKRGIQLAFVKNEAFAPATPDIPSNNTMEIEAVYGTAPSHRYFNMIQGEMTLAQEPAEGHTGSTETIENIRDSVYLTTLYIGDEKFKLVIDTGSSDTWVAKTGFQCVNPRSKQKTSTASCRIAKTYNTTPTFKTIPNQRFDIAYADGEFLTGNMAKDTVKFAGLTVKDQTFGLVTLAGWNGDTVSSGLTGLAYPSVTRAFAAGSAGGGKGKGPNIPYDPVFTSMWKQKLTAPYFSVALNRASEKPGVIAIGGLPGGDIKYSNDWVKAPMQHLFVGGKNTKDYMLYVVQTDGWDITSSKGVKQAQVATTKAKVVLDTGTTLSYLPAGIATAINKSFVPSAKNLGRGQWSVNCDAKAPKVAMVVSGKKIWFDGPDMILVAGVMGSGAKVCISGIQPTMGVGQPSILGGVFLKNVVAVHDIGAAEIRMANRIR